MDPKTQVPNKVLIVDSDPSTVKRLAEPMLKSGVALIGALDYSSALYRFNTEFFRVVMLDLKFHEIDPLAIIQKWRKHEVVEKRSCGFIVMASENTPKAVQALMEEIGGIEILKKPINPATLISIISRSFGLFHASETKRKLQHEILENLVARERYDEAIKAINARRPELGDQYYEMAAEVYEKAGQLDEAIKVVEKIPQGVMHPMKLLNLQGGLYLKMGRVEESRACYESADKIAPNQIERIAAMAELYLKMRMPEEAVKRFKQLIKANPEDPDYKFGCLQQLEDAGFPDQAAEFCRDTTAPKEVVRFYNNRGVMLAKDDKLGEALKQYDMALRFFPKNKDNFRIYFNMALANLKIKTPESRTKAVLALKKTLELNPEFDKAKETLSKMKIAG